MLSNEQLKQLGIDEQDFSQLNEAERNLVIQILDEMQNTGTSNTFNDLVKEDYTEMPVDILTFVDDYNYLGNAWHDAQGNSKLYPYWREELVKIFPDNVTTAVNNGIFTGSRGRGKSEICILIASYLLHRILCLKNPIAYYHLKPTEKIVFAFMNIKLALAEEIGVSKFQNTIQSSPWFMEHGELVGRTNKLWVPKKFNGQEAVDIKIGSKADDLVGLPVYFCFCDEISFIKNQSIDKQKQIANDMIDTAIGGMKTRFIHKGKNPTFLALASSKRSDKSFLEQHMKQKLESDKDNVYISDGSVWEVKPKGTYSDKTFRVGVGNKFLQSIVIPDDEPSDIYLAKGYSIIDVPIDFKVDFIDDIDRALCDFAGISSSSITKYISGAAFYSLINPNMVNPFTKEVIKVGNAPDDTAQYYDFFDLTKVPKDMMYKPLYVHLDMSVSGDKTGIAGVWIKGKKPSVDKSLQSKDLFFSAAFAVSIEAPKGRQISFEKNRNFIRWLKKVGFNIKGITSDTFQSYDLQQQLIAEGFPCEILSVDRVNQDRICVPYQYFKTTIYENRLEIFKDDLLCREVTDLERNIDNGKVDHPDGGSKDRSDAVCGAIFNASKHAEEYAFEYGEDLSSVVEINAENEIETLTQQFEESLKTMFANTPKPEESNNKPLGIDFGFGPPVPLEADYISEGILIW